MSLLISTGSGSSPRARGTHRIKTAKNGELRFIPAGAGNTPRPCWRRMPRAVHPRGRGEHRNMGCLRVASGGSSPRARGTPINIKTRKIRPRFIPAGAGNTVKKKRGVVDEAVHPRGRGEHLQRSDWVSRRRGSSPRARGTRRVTRSTLSRCGFIPAGAGNTKKCGALLCTLSVHPRGRGEHRRQNILHGQC